MAACKSVPWLLALPALQAQSLSQPSADCSLAILAPNLKGGAEPAPPEAAAQQRALAGWEAALGRQLEAILSLQKVALSARSAASGRSGGSAAPWASPTASSGAAQRSGGV